MNNKAMRQQRTFEYEGKQVQMFRHLEILVGACSLPEYIEPRYEVQTAPR